MNKSPTVGTETPSHIIAHDEYYEKRGTTDETKHKPSMPQPRIQHTQITTNLSRLFVIEIIETGAFVCEYHNKISTI